jgi:signal transduction histidine kinase/DNA-binding response OmpR family regulator
VEQIVDAPRGPRVLFIRRLSIAAPDGKPWLLGVARDVTELRHNEQRLREAARTAAAANDAKSRFLATMSHEIRTPINGIMGMIDLALRTESPPDRRQYLDLAQSSADTLLAIVNDILDFSKIEADKMTIEQVPFSLYALINDVTRPLALRAAEKKLDFCNQVAADLPLTPRGDPTRLRQVLTNLIGNAIKFTARGEVTLEVDAQVTGNDQARFRFAVRDTGPGISAEQQSVIFEAFMQGDGSITRRFGGTGLGLAISARLVEMMGGRIGLESELGAGACFSFALTLPCEGAADGPARMSLACLPDLRVLWIDSNAGRRAWFARMLDHWQVRTRSCSSVGAALAVAAATRPDAVIIDSAALADAGDGLPELLRCVKDGRVLALLAAGEALPAALEQHAVPVSKPLLPSELHRALLTTQPGAAPLRVDDSMPAEGPLERPFEGLRILLAEDNYVNRVLAEAVLKRLGAESHTAEQGAEALQMMGRTEFDLVLMDVQMPVLDGAEAVRLWRASEAQEGQTRRPLPIIAMTAHALGGDRERFLAGGFDGYVSKPFCERDLVTEVQRVLAGAPEPRIERIEGPQFPAESFRGDSLRELLGGNAALARRVAEAFTAVRADLEARLTNARAQRDADQLRRVAHEIKGMAGTMGARRLQALSAAIESCAGREPWPEFDRLCASFILEWRHVTREVDAVRPSK